MVDQLMLALPIVVGLLGTLFAVLERGWKRFKEEQSQNPDLKFGGAYLLNFLVSTGASATLVMTIIPAVVAGVTDVKAEALAALVILQFGFGYTSAYTILSKMNTSTERKLELLQAKAKLSDAEVGKLDATADNTKLVGKPDK